MPIWASQSCLSWPHTYRYCALCLCERHNSSWHPFALCRLSWVLEICIGLCLSPCRCDLKERWGNSSWYILGGGLCSLLAYSFASSDSLPTCLLPFICPYSCCCQALLLGHSSYRSLLPLPYIELPLSPPALETCWPFYRTHWHFYIPFIRAHPKMGSQEAPHWWGELKLQRLETTSQSSTSHQNSWRRTLDSCLSFILYSPSELTGQQTFWLLGNVEGTTCLTASN